MRSSMETSIQLIRKLQASQQETMLRLSSTLSSTAQEMQKSETLLGAIEEMGQNLKSYFSTIHLLLEIYDKELAAPVAKDTSPDSTEES